MKIDFDTFVPRTLAVGIVTALICVPSMTRAEDSVQDMSDPLCNFPPPSRAGYSDKGTSAQLKV